LCERVPRTNGSGARSAVLLFYAQTLVGASRVSGLRSAVHGLIPEVLERFRNAATRPDGDHGSGALAAARRSIVRSIGVRRTQRLTWPGRRRAAWCVRSCTRSWSAFAATGRLAINVPQVSANTGESSRKRLSFVRYAPLAGRRFADAIPGSGVSCGSSPAGCSEVSDSPSAAFRQAPTQVVRGFEGPRTRNRRCRPRVSRSTGRPPQGQGRRAPRCDAPASSHVRHVHGEGVAPSRMCGRMCCDITAKRHDIPITR
jgi:hypothetical protein